MARLGLFGRLLLIYLLAFAAILGAAVALGWAERGRNPDALIRPLGPDQLAAAVRLVEAGADEAAVLRVLTGPTLRAWLAEADPGPPPGRGERPAPDLAAALARGLDPARNHVEVFWRGPLPALAHLVAARDPVDRVTVRLDGGRYLVLDAAREREGRVALWLALHAAAVALLSALAVAREARPLRRLALAVARFDGVRVEPLPPARGAAEIRGLTEAVGAMQRRIAGLLRERSTTIGAMSHDLKTYLARMRLRAATVADPALREKMVRDVAEMAELLDTSIAFARGTAAGAHRERVDLAALAREQAEGWAERGRAVGLHAPHPVPVLGDPVALRRVLANLLENAARHGQAVAVAVRAERGRAVLTVSDDGPGIPEAERDAVFDAYCRLEPSRSRGTGGAGLGLAIVKQVAEAHGGAVRIGDAAEGGACVVVTLPLA